MHVVIRRAAWAALWATILVLFASHGKGVRENGPLPIWVWIGIWVFVVLFLSLVMNDEERRWK